MSNDPLRVLVADDQRAVREGLVTLCGLIPGVKVVGQAADGAEAMALTGELRPDVVLMDLRMPRVDGVAATRSLRERYPETSVVVLTTYADDEPVLQALAAGATSYLTKDAGREDIRRAIEAARTGQSVIDPVATASLIAAATRGASSSPALDGLSTREREVLKSMCDGLANGEIARALFISEATVKSHVNHLFTKLSVATRAQAIAKAQRWGRLS